jgi:hypothetical protein
MIAHTAQRQHGPKRPCAALLVLALVAGLATAGAADVALDHRPPACMQPGKPLRLRVCVRPHAHARHVTLHYRQGSEGAWRKVAMTSDMPCFFGRLPGIGRGPFSYFFTATVTGSGHIQSATFTGDTLRVDQGCLVVQRADAPPPVAARPRAGTPAARAQPTPSGGPTKPRRPAESNVGGSSKRTWLLLGAAGLAGGAAAVVAARSGQDGDLAEETANGANGSDGSDPASLSGFWLGTQTLTYPSGCVENSRIALRLTEESGTVGGTLSFTVTRCDCCPLGSGADPITGYSDATSLRFRTPALLEYDGQRLRQRLEGGLQGAGGITGSWSAQRQP